MLLHTLLLSSSVVLLLIVGQPKLADAWWFADTVADKISATAALNMDGVLGHFRFTRESPKGPTKCDYDITGLKGNNQLYHVHVKPLPAFSPDQLATNTSMLAALCGDPTTGGHLNPHHVKEKLPSKAAPLDKYEIGDLSGKHGPLQKVEGEQDRYKGSFVDPFLPMSGENSIIGRSIVIHKNDGKRWVCANILEDKKM